MKNTGGRKARAISFLHGIHGHYIVPLLGYCLMVIVKNYRTYSQHLSLPISVAEPEPEPEQESKKRYHFVAIRTRTVFFL
jgi:hypothetical protein